MEKNKLAVKWLTELEKEKYYLLARIKEIDKKIHFLNNTSVNCKCKDCQNIAITKKPSKKTAVINNEYFNS
jgi:hypothetical protein